MLLLLLPRTLLVGLLAYSRWIFTSDVYERRWVPYTRRPAFTKSFANLPIICRASRAFTIPPRRCGTAEREPAVEIYSQYIEHLSLSSGEQRMQNCWNISITIIQYWQQIFVLRVVSNLRCRREEKEKEEDPENGHVSLGETKDTARRLTTSSSSFRGRGHETTLREIYCIRGSRQPRVERASVGSNDTE